MSSPPNSPQTHRPMRATPVIAGSLAGVVLLAVCIATLFLLRKRKRRLQKERAIRMSEFLQDSRSDRSSRQSLPHEPATTPTPSDPDKHRPSSPGHDSPHRHHHHRRTPTPSSSPISSPSPHHRSIQLTNRAESEDNSNNNRLRQGRTSNSDVIFAHQDANVERSDGDSAGVLIPSIVISSNVNRSRDSFTRTGDRTDGTHHYDARILPPPDTRPSSRRTDGSTSLSIPSLAPQSSTLLYPTFDSSSSASSTSFSSPLLSSHSSSPTIPSSFIAPSSPSPILPSPSLTTAPSSPASKILLSSQNHERTVASVDVVPVQLGLVTGAAVIGPSLRRNDERSGGEDDAPPAYENLCG